MVQGGQAPTTLKTWLRAKEKTWLTEQTGLLGKAIQPAARGATGLMDRTLYFRNPRTRRQAIAWRRNTFGLRDWCACNKKFRRTFVDDPDHVHCGLLPQNIPPHVHNPSRPRISRIDAILNTLDEAEVKRVFDHLTKVLSENR